MIHINDIRSIKEFKNITFSKYKKSSVKEKLIKSINSGKLEESCYWSAEFICSGNYEELWEIIILFMSKHIHIGNPKLPVYISLKITEFKKIIENGYLNDVLLMRNNDTIRYLFGEIICVLCLSQKKHKYEQIKINKKDDYDLLQLTSKLQAPNTNYSKDYITPDDPKELHIAFNEFVYQISIQQKNNYMACFWIEWILHFEDICKKKGEKLIGKTRTIAPVQTNYYKDIIWLIWEIIIEESKNRNKIVAKNINSLIDIFSVKYTVSTKKKRRFVLYFAVSLLCENIDYTVHLIKPTKSQQIQVVLKNIHMVYKDVKKNEIAPKTDYLETHQKKTNIDKSIEKLNILYS